MNNSHPRHIRALEILPQPVREILARNADLSQWPESTMETMEKYWENHQTAESLDQISAGMVLMYHRFLPENILRTLETQAIAAVQTTFEPLTRKLQDNPWSLLLGERQDLMGAMIRHQSSWLTRLTHLVEPPYIADTFPAFLLESSAFGSLREAIGDATSSAELDTATADELQYFVDHYRHYMVQDKTITSDNWTSPDTTETAALPRMLG